VLDAEGQPVKAASAVTPGEALAIEFADGRVNVEVTGAKPDSEGPLRPAAKRPVRKSEPGGQGSLF